MRRFGYWWQRHVAGPFNRGRADFEIEAAGHVMREMMPATTDHRAIDFHDRFGTGRAVNRQDLN